MCISHTHTHSAGIGRTGAFCALSTAIERVKAEGMIDVFHTVKHLRTQRPHMVQTVVSAHSLKLALVPGLPCFVRVLILRRWQTFEKQFAAYT